MPTPSKVTSAKPSLPRGRDSSKQPHFQQRRATTLPPVNDRTIVVLEGDETGQELLEEALRVLAADVTGLDLEFER